MMKTAFVTDSGTGESMEVLSREGIYSVPLQISCGEQSYSDSVDITIDEVYERMREGAMLSTSLPSVGKIEELFEQLKAEGYERIFAVVEEVKHACEEVVHTTDTLLLPDDLQHLKRGGRLTPLAATLGGLLKIKPILQINEHTKGKIDVAGKVRTMSKAMDTVIERMKQAGVDRRYSVTVAHADAPEAAEVYRRKIEAAIEGVQVNVIKLVSVVGVHTGRGCQALQYFCPLSEE